MPATQVEDGVRSRGLMDHGLGVKKQIVFVKIGTVLTGKTLPFIPGSNLEARVVKTTLKIAVVPNISGSIIG